MQKIKTLGWAIAASLVANVALADGHSSFRVPQLTDGHSSFRVPQLNDGHSSFRVPQLV